MNTKNTLITIGGLCLIGLVAFVFYPSQSKAGGGRYKIEPSISIEPYKSDAVRVGESYERMMGRYINTMDNRLGTADRGFDKISTKLDTMTGRLGTMDKGLDKVSTKLDSMGNRLAISGKGIEKVSTKLDAMGSRLAMSDKGVEKVSAKLDAMENRLGMTDRGFDKVTTKLDTIEKKIDDLAMRLTAIEKALNITEEIPKPK